jgi:uncharacterized protein (TIGR02118 family)
MIKYVALYRTPDDPDEFERRYLGEHVPLADATPGLVRTEVARVSRVYVPGFLGDAQPYLMAELYFASEQAMKRAFASPEWKAAGANLAEIGGMELVCMFAAEAVPTGASGGGTGEVTGVAEVAG